MTTDDGREWVAIEDIAGVAELAAEYGVSRATISNWAARYPDFPKALRGLAAGPIYSRRAVRAWHDAKPWQHDGPGTRHRTDSRAARTAT